MKISLFFPKKQTGLSYPALYSPKKTILLGAIPCRLIPRARKNAVNEAYNEDAFE